MTTTTRTDLYEVVTNQIIDQLEQGIVPWAQPWTTAGATEGGLLLPRNVSTLRDYRGINILLLWVAAAKRGFASHRWLTFQQALDMGAHVRKGERGTKIVFADRFVPRDAKIGADGQPVAVWFLKQWTVFAAEQVDGLPEPVQAQPVDMSTVDARCAAILTGSGASIAYGAATACYMPAADRIALPAPAQFTDPVNFHRTALHELGHWTGHKTRLDRDLRSRAGTADYAREELVAEMTAAFACAALSIVPTVRHADYIGAWLKALKDDKRAIFQAARLAQQAADYLLAFETRAAETALAA